jgi:threonine/homoserine/homoserine lactone efflux protein
MKTLLPYLLPVYLTYIMATASPGPSNMAIMATAMSRGRGPALALAAGVVTGSMFWAVLAATGLSAVLATYADLLTIIRIVGGLYLIYLAWKAARAAISARPDPSVASGPATGMALYRRGLFLHLSNPKAIIAWIAIMSLGLAPGAPGGLLSLILLGCVSLGIAIFAGYALVFSTPPMVRAYGSARRAIEGAVAVFFVYAGLRLIFSRS